MAHSHERTLLELVGDAQGILDEVRRPVADLPQEHPPFDVAAACERWVRGVGTRAAAAHPAQRRP